MKSNLSPSQGKIMSLDKYESGMVVKSNQSLVSVTETSGKYSVYRYLGTVPATITSPPSAGSSWELLFVSNSIEWLTSKMSSSDGFGMIGQVSSVSDLPNLSTDLTRVLVKGSAGGEFELITGSYTADGGDIFQSSVSGKFWSRIRRIKGVKHSVEYGAVTDASTDSTDNVNAMLASMTSGTAIIDPDVKFALASLTIPPGVVLVINSSWDGSAWTLPPRFVSSRSEGLMVVNSANASLVLDNLSGTPYSKITYRLNGTVNWVAGMDDATSPDYQIKQGSITKYRVSKSGDQHAWNKDSLTSGVDYERGKRDSSNLVSRTASAGAGYSITEQYYHGATLGSAVVRTSDGKIQMSQLGTNTVLFDVNGEILGSPKKVTTVSAATALTKAQTGTIVTNNGATAAIVVTLPDATVGAHFEFLVNAAYLLTAKCAGTNTIRGGATSVAASDAGSRCRLVCVIAGTWELESIIGTWAS